MGATIYQHIGWSLVAQTGMYAQEASHDVQTDQEWIKGPGGDEVAGAIYNPRSSWSLNGFVRTDETLGAAMGASLVLANTVTWSDFISGIPAGSGITAVTGAKRGAKVDGAKTVDLSGEYKPFIMPAA